MIVLRKCNFLETFEAQDTGFGRAGCIGKKDNTHEKHSSRSSPQTQEEHRGLFFFDHLNFLKLSARILITNSKSACKTFWPTPNGHAGWIAIGSIKQNSLVRHEKMDNDIALGLLSPIGFPPNITREKCQEITKVSQTSSLLAHLVRRTPWEDPFRLSSQIPIQFD